MIIIRTQKEIEDKYLQEKDEIFSFATDLLYYLSWDTVKKYIKEEYVKEVESGEKKWEQLTNPIGEIVNYIPFAWDKANNCRGLSAQRSINHFMNWFWLIDKDFYIKLKNSYDNAYCYYGKPQLVSICNHLERISDMKIDWKQYDAKNWVQHKSEEETPQEEIDKIISNYVFE